MIRELYALSAPQAFNKLGIDYFVWHVLQIEYPENVHLIRGNHEAADINALFGFRIECIERMVSVESH